MTGVQTCALPISTAIVLKTPAKFKLDCIQLHGNETPFYLESLRKEIADSIQIIKACSIGNEEDLLSIAKYDGLCDFLLFDTPTHIYGGSGTSFEWNLLQNYKGTTPFFLSGGIGPGHLEQLRSFHHTQFAGIDLNSRFEVAPALKNIPLLKDFIQQIKTIHP